MVCRSWVTHKAWRLPPLGHEPRAIGFEPRAMKQQPLIIDCGIDLMTSNGVVKLLITRSDLADAFIDVSTKRHFDIW